MDQRPPLHLAPPVHPKLKALREELEQNGYRAGTPEFEQRYRAKHVDICQEIRRVQCSYCSLNPCAVLTAHMEDLRGSGGTHFPF